MDKTFKRWTIGAVIAAIIGAFSLWWAGSTNGIDNVCNMLGVQTTPYCVHASDSHLWYLLLSLAAIIYLGFYVTRVRRQPSQEQRPSDTCGSQAARGQDPHTLTVSCDPGGPRRDGRRCSYHATAPRRDDDDARPAARNRRFLPVAAPRKGDDDSACSARWA